jgi:hypothetical protein
MRRHTRHRGYVLVLTLLLLALAATALAGVCRLSLEKAVRATRAQEDLQRRWGVTSCRAALLPKAPMVLARSVDRPGDGRGEARMSFRLGGQSVTLVFGDEQAKANVNLLYALDGRAGADRAVRALAQAAGATAMRVELRPARIEQRDEDEAEPRHDGAEAKAGKLRSDAEILLELTVEPAFEGWGQVFRGAGADDLLRRRGPLPAVASNLTCWGDGMVNVRRASPEAITAACERWLRPGEVAKLVAARDEDPDFDLWEALDALALSEDRLEAVELLLTDESTCYSLWTIIRTGEREWYDLAVANVAASGGAVSDVRVFSW